MRRSRAPGPNVGARPSPTPSLPHGYQPRWRFQRRSRYQQSRGRTWLKVQASGAEDDKTARDHHKHAPHPQQTFAKQSGEDSQRRTDGCCCPSWRVDLAADRTTHELVHGPPSGVYPILRTTQCNAAICWRWDCLFGVAWKQLLDGSVGHTAQSQPSVEHTQKTRVRRRPANIEVARARLPLQPDMTAASATRPGGCLCKRT